MANGVSLYLRESYNENKNKNTEEQATIKVPGLDYLILEKQVRKTIEGLRRL